MPEEVERVLLGVEAYFGLRKHVEEPALSVFGDKEKEQQVIHSLGCDVACAASQIN